MAYVHNPVFLGVGTLDKADQQAALVRNAAFKARFRNAYVTFLRMPEAQRVKFMNEIRNAVATLPANQQQFVNQTAQTAASDIDPRNIPGLGNVGAAASATQAIHWTQSAANIAGVVASIATLGLTTWNFIDQRKASKEQADMQARQQSLQEQQMKADLERQQAEVDAVKAQREALERQKAQEEERRKLEDSGYTIAPDGQIVKKPSALPALGIAAAAAVGAFMLT